MGNIRHLPEKERRKVRRRNHIARDLHKYHQRVVPSKRKRDYIDDREEDY